VCYVIRGGGPGSHLAAGACARAGCCVGMKHIKQAHASMRTEREPNPRNGSFYSAYFILGSSVADYLFVMGLENCWIILYLWPNFAQPLRSARRPLAPTGRAHQTPRLLHVLSSPENTTRFFFLITQYNSDIHKRSTNGY